MNDRRMIVAVMAMLALVPVSCAYGLKIQPCRTVAVPPGNRIRSIPATEWRAMGGIAGRAADDSCPVPGHSQPDWNAKGMRGRQERRLIAWDTTRMAPLPAATPPLAHSDDAGHRGSAWRSTCSGQRSLAPAPVLWASHHRGLGGVEPCDSIPR